VILMAEEKKEMKKESRPKEKPKAGKPVEARKEAPKAAEVKHAAPVAHAAPAKAPVHVAPAHAPAAHSAPAHAPVAHAHAAPAAAPVEKAEKKPKKARKKKLRTEHARGKRKECIARATVKEGSGRIRVNSMLSTAIGNRYFKEIVEEPVALLGPDGLAVDIEVHVRGGGTMGQAQACRTAIARALGKYFGEKAVNIFKESDDWILREDSRRVEPKKYKGPKARARFQKSYR
jgi:small subunit ribosomal protein S9